MNVLIDINHPGQVHLFRNVFKELHSSGHHVIVCLKNIPMAEKLLDIYGIKYISLGSKSQSIIGKAFNQFKYDWKIWQLIQKYKIDIAIGSSISVDHAAYLSRSKALHFSDDDPQVVPLTVKFAYPFADHILCPDVLSFPEHKHKVIAYSGYHELAYLHPNRFQPDIKVLNEAGLTPDEPFFIMRFNAFKAHHDIGVYGMNIVQKLNLIQILKPYGKILITTEGSIEPQLREYQITISPEKMHSLLAYATMFIGDSQTMTSEAAVLGVPALRCNTLVGRIAYLEDEEHKYGLTYGFTPDQFEAMGLKVLELLKMPNLKNVWQLKRQQMLNEKIDVTAFIVWFIENYPRSVSIMKENPSLQYTFK